MLYSEMGQTVSGSFRFMLFGLGRFISSPRIYIAIQGNDAILSVSKRRK
jgi:hypothetical protein